MNKEEVKIEFVNGRFNVNLSEGESIDLRLKNDNGYIYIGKVDDISNNSKNIKTTGYSTVGLDEDTIPDCYSNQDDEKNTIGDDKRQTSSIYNILENYQEKENQNDEEPEQSDDTPTAEEANEYDNEQSDEVKQQSQKEEDKSSIINRYMPLEDEDE